MLQPLNWGHLWDCKAGCPAQTLQKGCAPCAPAACFLLVLGSGNNLCYNLSGASLAGWGGLRGGEYRQSGVKLLSSYPGDCK